MEKGKLLRGLFGKKLCDLNDSSLRSPHAAKCRVGNTKILKIQNGNGFLPGSDATIRVYVGQNMKIWKEVKWMIEM